jgi:hypothetical protein
VTTPTLNHCHKPRHLPAVAVISVVVASVAPNRLVESKAAAVVLAISAAGVVAVGDLLVAAAGRVAVVVSVGLAAPKGELGGSGELARLVQAEVVGAVLGGVVVRGVVAVGGG